MKLYKKKAVAMFTLALLLTSLVFIQIGFGQPGVAYIAPPVIITNVGENFTIAVMVDVEIPIEQFDFELYWMPDLMTVYDVTFSPPWITLDLYIGADWVWVWGGVTDPVGPGVIQLAEITFHCDGLGDSDLMFDYVSVMDEFKEWWYLPVQGAYVYQTEFYWKPAYPDYAPSGVPDFDQRQDNWGKIDQQSGAWKWTWCGPTAVANSLWWMDSRFEPGVIPPPTISDGYPLLTAYGPWDDHDQQNVKPFITDLGWYMDTDGIRTGYPWSGTDVHQMEKGIAMYLRERGLETEFVIKKMAKPHFYYIEDEIEKCEDVILLLGIWQTYDGITWWRVGGHYVTCAGVWSAENLIAFSDPDADSAETVGNGMWLPPGPPHPHPPRPIVPPQEDVVHNDASYVSHDLYVAYQGSESPGGDIYLDWYEPLEDPDFIYNIQGQNCPSEFWEQQGEYTYEAYTTVEVEYSVIISPAEWYFKPPQEDYAPSGVPDFDQKQYGIYYDWTNPYPPIGSWSWCGPTAVANSLWWLDSQFEPNPALPPEISDGFPLVPSFGEWDDHDPQNVPYLIDYLGSFMNTDNNWGMQGDEHCGTRPTDMERGIYWWLQEMGLDWKFYNHTEKAPEFYWIEEEIERCEDVILLLGFWQNYGDEIEPYWVRNGGHYVTCVGVDSENMMLAISDPFIDNAEWGFPGRVIPPEHPHEGIPETLHNNATYVSHDFYMVGPSPSPGGNFGLYQYPAEDIIDNFDSCQNLPEEFIEYDGDYWPGLPIYTEIEYAVVISCNPSPVVATGSEDGYVRVHDSFGNLLWNWGTEAYCVSVAFDNDARYLAGGWRYGEYGMLGFFDVNARTDGGWNDPLWWKDLPISESYHHLWGYYESSGHESMSVDVKYNSYNEFYIVAAAHDYGLNLYDEWGNLIWQYFDEEGAETIVRISQDGNYIVCADDYATGTLHYFSHLGDGVPGWGPGDGTPIWSFGSYEYEYYGVLWTAISGIGDYVAVGAFNMDYGGDVVILLNRTGNMVWQHIGVGEDGSHITKVDMPCHGRSVVAITEDLYNWYGCDLYYFDDGGDGWDSGDGTPVWTYWPGKVDFFDDVESGTDGWTSDGLWHITSHRSFSPTHAWYYGQEGVWTFDTGVANRGNLTSPTIDLTSATMANMTFKYWYETEEPGTTFDQRWVDISVDGGLFAPFVQLSGDPMGVWLNITIDLTGFVGHAIQIQFRFDTIDDELNYYEGWYIDDVAINAEEGGEHDVYDDFYTVSISGNGDVISAGGDDGTSNLYVFGKDGTLLDKEWDGVTVQSVDQTFAGQYGVVGSCDSGYAMYDKSIGSWAWGDNAFGPIRSVAISKIYPCMFPFPDHDVAVIDVTPLKTVVGQGLKMRINATVENQGDFTETNIQVTVYANNTAIQTLTIPSLAPGAQMNLTFTWTSTDFAKGEYIISAIVALVYNEIDVYDNTYIDGVVKVAMPGDLDTDMWITIADVSAVAVAFGSYPGHPKWFPNADFDDDDFITIADVSFVAGHFGEYDP